MRDFAFIHANEDVAEILYHAADLGLIIRRDEPMREPRQDIIGIEVIPRINDGIFMVYRSNWVFDPPEYNLIEAGYRKGLYDQKPSTNCINIVLNFRREHYDGDMIRLGNGSISRDIRWYRSNDHTVHAAPLEVKVVFDDLIKKIDTKKYIDVGGRRYTVLRGALKKLVAASYRPPFDFMDNEPIHDLAQSAC